MPITKNYISSPLEAGPSLLGARQLPAELTSALDYVSSRLARKRLHLSLIVIRKDVNIPSMPSPQPSQQSESSGRSITSSSTRSLFSNASSTFSRSLSKHSSQSSMSDAMSTTSASSASSFSRTKWPGLPSSPKGSTSTLMFTAPSTPLPSQPSPPTTPNPYGISLMHASTMTAKAEKVLRHYIAKAERKFSIGSGWLSSQALTTNIECPATNELIRRSLAQNEVIYSSECLALLSLDHVYSFKCHLHTYSRTLSPVNLTSAVDELRRLVLAQYRRRITKGYLMRAYDWLSISLAALVDVNEGYKVAYGGMRRSGGIEVQNEERRSPPPLKTNFDLTETRHMKLSIAFNGQGPSSPSSSEESSPTTCSRCGNDSYDETGLVKVGESAKGRDGDVRHDRGPHRRGPVTPNGFEDITPVTKGEWCFLMVGEGWKEAKTAAVETC